MKNPSRPTAKGNYWTVNTSTIPRDLLARQNTQVSRQAQDIGFSYRKDLTEVFDCQSGRIKIDIPLSLFKGVGLIEDPGAVMQRLLLEPKCDGEAARPNDGRSGRLYSLVDLFDQEDIVDECLRNVVGQSLQYDGGIVKPAISTSNNSTHQIRNMTSAGVFPSNDVEKQQQAYPPNEALGRALTGGIPSFGQYPFLQAVYNNTLQMGLPSQNQPRGLSPAFSPKTEMRKTAENDFEDESLSSLRASVDAVVAPVGVKPSGAMQASNLDQNFSCCRAYSEGRELSKRENDQHHAATLKGLFTAFSTRPLEIGGKMM